MAEVAAKKSINVVSSKKSSEACGAQSNNGLIDLDNITSCSNNQLITLSDDDLVLTNNTKNDINVDDKSLQELIESELALRISSTGEMDTGDEAEYDVIGYIKGTEVARSQPEITKIVLEPRPNTQDINSEFIIAEMNHYNVIEDRYGHQNGHFSPDLKSNAPEKFEDSNGIVETHSNQLEQSAGDSVTEQTIVAENSELFNTDTIRDVCGKDVRNSAKSGDFEETQTSEVSDGQYDLDNVDGDSSGLLSNMDHITQDHIEKKVSSADLISSERVSLETENCYEKPTEDYSLLNFGHTEQQTESKDSADQIFDSSSKTTEVLDTWSNTESSSDTIQIGQFSDNFDESLQQVENQMQPGFDVEGGLLAQEQNLSVDRLVELGVHEDKITESLPNQCTDLIKSADPELEGSFEILKNTVETDPLPVENSSVCKPQLESEEEVLLEKETVQQTSKNLAEDSDWDKKEIVEDVTSTSTHPNEKCEEVWKTENLSSFEISSSSEFIEFERQDVQEMTKQVITENNKIVAEDSQDFLTQDETFTPFTIESSRSEESQVVVKSKESISTVEIIQATEKTSSNETSRVFSESKYADHCFMETPGHGQDFESWTTVEQAISVPSLKVATEEESNQMVSNDPNLALTNLSDDLSAVDLQQLAPLATPDDEISDVSNKCELHVSVVVFTSLINYISLFVVSFKQ